MQASCSVTLRLFTSSPMSQGWWWKVLQRNIYSEKKLSNDNLQQRIVNTLFSLNSRQWLFSWFIVEGLGLVRNKRYTWKCHWSWWVLYRGQRESLQGNAKIKDPTCIHFQGKIEIGENRTVCIKKTPQEPLNQNSQHLQVWRPLMPELRHNIGFKVYKGIHMYR